MKYFGQNTLAHHEMTSNLNKVNDIVDPQIKLRPTPEKKHMNRSFDCHETGGICLGKQHYHFDALTIQKACELQLTG